MSNGSRFHRVLKEIASTFIIGELEELRNAVDNQIRECKRRESEEANRQTHEVVCRWAPDCKLVLTNGPANRHSEAVFHLYQPRKQIVWIKTFPPDGKGGFRFEPLILADVRAWGIMTKTAHDHQQRKEKKAQATYMA